MVVLPAPGFRWLPARLLGKHYLSGKPLLVRVQGAEVNAARAAATFGILPVPGQVSVRRQAAAVTPNRVTQPLGLTGQIVEVDSDGSEEGNRIRTTVGIQALRRNRLVHRAGTGAVNYEPDHG